MSAEPVEAFARLVAVPPHEVDLARAALAIAAAADPALEPDRWLAELDRMAEGVADAESVRVRLFEDLGFSGNTRDYYDPENSYLHRVIERRVGLPITLSLIVIEVGRRAAVDFEGIGMPGHFLVRARETGRYLDPFGGGELLDEAGCEELFRRATGAGPDVPFTDDLLAPVDEHELLGRMLANLKAIHASRGRPADLEWVLRMRLVLPGVPVTEIEELGRTLAGMGRFAEGASEIELRAAPLPEDVAAPLLLAARSIRARLN